MNTTARAQERFNSSAFPATPVPVVPVAGARPPIPMAAEQNAPAATPVVASAPAGAPVSDGTVVKFADGSTRISPENDAIIKQAASQYAQTGYRLLVEGLPAANNPEAISKARAQAGTVARYLISYGIATTGVMISTGTPDSTGKGNTVTVRVAPYL
jgi:outer membrane protein OmpA-like peptidoglycan-associated protein